MSRTSFFGNSHRSIMMKCDEDNTDRENSDCNGFVEDSDS